MTEKDRDRLHETSAVAWSAATLGEANIIRGLLESGGIPAVIDDEIIVGVLDGMVTGNKGIRVVVPADRLSEARRLIEEAHEEGLGPLAEAGEEE